MKTKPTASKMVWALPALLLVICAVFLVSKVRGEIAPATNVDLDMFTQPRDQEDPEPRPEIVREYYESGDVKSVFRLRDGRRTGKAFHFYMTGDLRKVETWRDDVLHGTFATFHPGGGIASHGSMIEGRVHGAVDFFKEDRSLKYVEFYEEGICSGRQYH